VYFCFVQKRFEVGKNYFQFKQFRIEQKSGGLKVTTDACLFGAWVAREEQHRTINRALDIGTGTGLLALMLAQRNPCEIEAIELNGAASDEAKLNFENSPWADRLKIHPGALQGFQTVGCFDVILCNPPFFHGDLKGKSHAKNQAMHSDGLTSEELALHTHRLLAPDGRMYVLYPPKEMELFAGHLAGYGLHAFVRVTVHDREGGRALREMAGFGRRGGQVIEEQIFIKNAEGYSMAFQGLVADYYL
jgi:tRNA1Val (adenine37-N6)-methyltransferase